MKKENPSFILLRKALPKDFNFNQIDSITSVLAVEYGDNVYEELKLSIRNNELIQFSKKYSFDSAKNALQLFLIKKKNSTFLMCILFSPVEYLENEYVMDMISFSNKFDIQNFSEAEVIFKN